MHLHKLLISQFSILYYIPNSFEQRTAARHSSDNPFGYEFVNVTTGIRSEVNITAGASVLYSVFGEHFAEGKNRTGNGKMDYSSV